MTVEILLLCLYGFVQTDREVATLKSWFMIHIAAEIKSFWGKQSSGMTCHDIWAKYFRGLGTSSFPKV